MSADVAAALPVWMRPDRLPAWLRASTYGLAVAVLFYLALTPIQELPGHSIWDKAQHAIAWFVLAAIGHLYWPLRPGRIAAFALFVGVLIEILQATLPLGRQGELPDLLADLVGIAAALAAWAAASLLLRRPWLRRRSA